MKSIIFKSIFVASCSLFLFACGDNMGETDSRVADVKSLIEPANGRTIALEPSASASMYFEWDYAVPNAGGSMVYQIAFDRADGDFSSPVYILASGNNGFNNSITLTHKQMNKIAGMAGIAPSETGNIKWTIFASKGTKTVKAAAENSLAITRLAGFEDLPFDVFVTGDASEGGTDLSKAHQMKAISGGEFEIYTYLKGGQPFYFVDNIKAGSMRKFNTDNGLIKENGTTTVSADGVYCISLDFNIGACTYSLVTGIGFYFSPSDAVLFDLPYVGYGVFRAVKQTVTFKEESGGRDERYKFRMFIKEQAGAGADKELEWATLNQTDSRPNATSPESYYYMRLTESLTQWDNKWKLMSDFDDVAADYTIYLTADKPYTHEITK